MLRQFFCDAVVPHEVGALYVQVVEIIECIEVQMVERKKALQKEISRQVKASFNKVKEEALKIEEKRKVLPHHWMITTANALVDDDGWFFPWVSFQSEFQEFLEKRWEGVRMESR